MPDGKIDVLDVGALERAVNDSATRVSGLWLSFVAFAAYLAAAASMISHRQIFLEEPIKLPTINIDLPLVASAILLPLLFMIYHVFVLLQVVLLARTADAYNQALHHAIEDSEGRTFVRQRLANTLFAQLFAGSPREREGVLGWLLRLMAWITLAIAPVLVLILFEIKFLPDHSAAITWTHRSLIACDLLVVLILWASAVKPGQDISWRSMIAEWRFLAGAIIVIIMCVLITFPGEPVRTVMRQLDQTSSLDSGHPDCWSPGPLAMLYSERLILLGADFINADKLEKIVAAAKANGQHPYESDRTVAFRGRDLRCAQFAGADLRRADFSGADLTGASLKAAHLDGAIFSGARLHQVTFDGAQMQGAYFSGESNEAKNSDDLLKPAELPGASLRDAQLQGASLNSVTMPGINLDGAQMQGADLDGANMQHASLQRTQLAGATLKSVRLQTAMLVSTQAPGASFDQAQLQAAAIGSADLEAAEFDRSMLQGTRLNSSRLALANFSNAYVWRSTGAQCVDAQVTGPSTDPILGFEHHHAYHGGSTTVPLSPDDEGFDKFVAQAVKSLPLGMADQIRQGTNERLAKDANVTGEPSDWSGCAENAIEQDAYREKRAGYLAKLVCRSGSNGGHIAAGLSRNMWSLMGMKGVQAFARELLGPDGATPCPGAKDLNAKVKAELIEAMRR